MVRRWGQVAAVDPYGNPNLRLGLPRMPRLPQLGAPPASAAAAAAAGRLSEPADRDHDEAGEGRGRDQIADATE